MNELAFSLTAGPLAVYFEDGAILGIASDPSLNSILVWDEAVDVLSQSPSSLDRDQDLFAIPESGQFSTDFWKQIVGSSVSRMTILKFKQMSAKKRTLPSEVGLRICLSNGASFVASHGLHNRSDDFSVLEESQLVSAEWDEFPIT